MPYTGSTSDMDWDSETVYWIKFRTCHKLARETSAIQIMMESDGKTSYPFHNYWDSGNNVETIVPKCMIYEGVLGIPEGIESKLKC